MTYPPDEAVDFRDFGAVELALQDDFNGQTPGQRLTPGVKAIAFDVRFKQRALAVEHRPQVEAAGGQLEIMHGMTTKKAAAG